LNVNFMEYLDTRQELLDRFPKNRELPCFSIRAMEFGATYPFEDEIPHARQFHKLGWYTGSNTGRIKESLPSYAREAIRMFPDWKQRPDSREQ
jgi:DNA (cytosine-5)-methyltransferase 1